MVIVLGEGRLVTEPFYGARFLIFVTCLIVGAISSYAYRLYLSDAGDKAQETAQRETSDRALQQSSWDVAHPAPTPRVAEAPVPLAAEL